METKQEKIEKFRDEFKSIAKTIPEPVDDIRSKLVDLENKGVVDKLIKMFIYNNMVKRISKQGKTTRYYLEIKYLLEAYELRYGRLNPSLRCSYICMAIRENNDCIVTLLTYKRYSIPVENRWLSQRGRTIHPESLILMAQLGRTELILECWKYYLPHCSNKYYLMVNLSKTPYSMAQLVTLIINQALLFQQVETAVYFLVYCAQPLQEDYPLVKKMFNFLETHNGVSLPIDDAGYIEMLKGGSGGGGDIGENNLGSGNFTIAWKKWLQLADEKFYLYHRHLVNINN